MISEFEAWWEREWQNSFMGKQEARDAWNAALDAAVDKVRISNNPDHLVNMLEEAKEC